GELDATHPEELQRPAKHQKVLEGEWEMKVPIRGVTAGPLLSENRIDCMAEAPRPRVKRIETKTSSGMFFAAPRRRFIANLRDADI
ncbi:MAG TPA: hypothetical protein VHB50_11430, partial [Bryobacteraceae bacterium]|nr:hypothetical protein [Bryobacteraceae bacterium]